jgi:hypothetical protein
MERVYRRDCLGDLAARLAFGACAEERVDNNLHRSELTRRRSVSYGFHQIGGDALFGDGVGTLRLDCLNDCHIDSRSREHARDHPPISTIVSWTGEYDGTIAQSIPVPARDLVSRGRAGALHQDA